MEKLISVKQLAIEFGIDRSGLLRKVKKLKVPIFKKRDENGQLYYLISEEDADRMRADRTEVLMPEVARNSDNIRGQLEHVQRIIASILSALKG